MIILCKLIIFLSKDLGFLVNFLIFYFLGNVPDVPFFGVTVRFWYGVVTPVSVWVCVHILHEILEDSIFLKWYDTPFTPLGLGRSGVCCYTPFAPLVLKKSRFGDRSYNVRLRAWKARLRRWLFGYRGWKPLQQCERRHAERAYYYECKRRIELRDYESDSFY